MEDKEYDYMNKVTPNQEARSYFMGHGLTYDDVTKPRFNKLVEILQKYLDKRNEEQSKIKNKNKKDYTYQMDKCIYNKPTVKRPYMTAYIHVKVDNYSVREGISFNSDEFIGFAGWASTYNTVLFTDAFKEWVDWVVWDKQMSRPAFPHVLEDRLFADRFSRYISHGGNHPGYGELTSSDLNKIVVILDSLHNKDKLTQEDIVNVQDMSEILLQHISYLQDKIIRLANGEQ